MNETLVYDQDQESIGEWLRLTRQKKNMSVADVAAHLRLREARVVAIEQDDFHEDMTAYVKGYIRGYGSLLGLPGDDIEARLASLVVEQKAFESPMDIKSSKKYRFSQWWQGARILLLLSVLGALVLWVGLRSWGVGHPVDDSSAQLEALVKVEQPDASAALSDDKVAQGNNEHASEETEEALDQV
jgi:cytoskeletal protein RodZ